MNKDLIHRTIQRSKKYWKIFENFSSVESCNEDLRERAKQRKKPRTIFSDHEDSPKIKQKRKNSRVLKSSEEDTVGISSELPYQYTISKYW